MNSFRSFIETESTILSRSVCAFTQVEQNISTNKMDFFIVQIAILSFYRCKSSNSFYKQRKKRKFLSFKLFMTEYSLSLRTFLLLVDYEEETFDNSNDVFCDDVGSFAFSGQSYTDDRSDYRCEQHKCWNK